MNCAGRTRSIIGAQSLINAGLPNKVIALKNGTMGWHLAGLKVARGETRSFGPQGPEAAKFAQAAAANIASQDEGQEDRQGGSRQRSRPKAARSTGSTCAIPPNMRRAI